MPLHLIKLCVGCDSVKDLEDWIREKLKDRKKRGLPREHMHRTRMVPKRADELLDGGSLYLGHPRRGAVPAAAPRRAAVRRQGGHRPLPTWCSSRSSSLVEPRPWRAFQGWRYLAAEDAPRDLDRAAPGAKNMPEALRRELRELGLL